MKKRIVTIARQYGSRGREIGRKLAEELGVKYYDRDLISMAAEQSGYSREVLDSADEKAANSLLYTLALGSSLYAHGVDSINVPLNDKLYIYQSNIIKDVYNSGEGAVIVGRCADYVLEDKPDVAHVFITADFDDRVKTVAERSEISESKAKDRVVKTDRRRANYYNYYTGKKWGKADGYDLIINSSKSGVDGAIAVIKAFLEIDNE
ncbi:MAG: cytidylate kinase-like family protein [Clostridia bacterium]|nr:cytidylate kinase-like family protein [Clostridia bacterium]